MVTRVIYGPAHLADEAQAREEGTIGVDTSNANAPASKVHQGVYRIGAGDERATATGVTRQVVSHAGVTGGSVLDTLQRSGREPSCELEPGNPASRTSVEVAIRMGRLEYDANGKLREVAVGEPQGTAANDESKAENSPAQAEQSNQDAQFFDHQDEEDWAADIAPLPQAGYDAAVASSMGAILRGDDMEKTAASLAKNAGIPLELASEYVEQGVAKYQRTADRLMASMGLSGPRMDECYEFIRQQPQKMQDAMQRMVYANDLSGFRALAVAFKVQNPGDLSAFQKAGFEVHVDRDTGETMLRRPGGNWVKASDLMKG
jgi:hypothetical protein